MTNILWPRLCKKDSDAACATVEDTLDQRALHAKKRLLTLISVFRNFFAIVPKRIAIRKLLTAAPARAEERPQSQQI